MYYLTAETKCYLTTAVTGPYSESLMSLTKPLAHGITDGSLSHGKHSPHHRDPIFTALSGTEMFSSVPRGWVCRRAGPQDFHKMGEKQTNTINRWKPSDGRGHTGYLFKELLSPNGNFQEPFHLELAEVYFSPYFLFVFTHFSC